MSTTYKVIAGDTFNKIARKVYGSETQSFRIAEANPGLLQPLVAGLSIITPVLQDAPQDIPHVSPSDNPDEVSITINGTRFRFWTSVRIIRAIDAMDTVEFSAPFDHQAPGFRENFRPFSFAPITIQVGGRLLFTGSMVGVDPVIDAGRKSISVSAYSLPAVLNDCTMTASAIFEEGREFDGLGLRDIAESIVRGFGLSVDFNADQGSVFDQVAIDTSSRILDFLTGLAQQRNLILSSSPRGALTFLQSADASEPTARLSQGSSPLVSVTPFFSPQQYYSHITGFEQVSTGTDGSQHTVKNPRLDDAIRPLNFNVPDTEDADIVEATESKMGRMFADALSYSVTVSTWRDASGDLWEPNTTVQVFAPDALIYNDFDFIIRSVEFDKDANSETATLNLVIPGAYQGEIPERFPWD